MTAASAVVAGTLLAVLLCAPAAGSAAAEPTGSESPGSPGSPGSPETIVEQQAVEGSGSPGQAPEITDGRYLDVIREPETLWYAVPAEPGQAVGVTVVVRGRPDGAETDRSELRVTLLDGQQQEAVDPATEPFTGVSDARVELISDPLPPIEVQGAGAYLTVSLASPQAANDLAELGYQLEIALDVTGEPRAVPTEPSAPEATVPAAPASPSSPPRAPPEASGGGGYTVAVALVGLAAGGALGFETTRKRRRRGG